jgi:serine/threonine protein kinase/Tfp pilus assembly protein PilF
LEAGERLDLTAYARNHPEHVEPLRKLMPALEALVLTGQRADGEFAAESKGDASGATGSRLLGDFRLIRELGRGGMGMVFEAEQLSMGRRVALKVLPFAALAQDKSLQRFRNEVRAAAALDHPHIVSIYSVGEERGVHYYAMQLVRGKSLAEVIAELRREPVASGQLSVAKDAVFATSNRQLTTDTEPFAHHSTLSGLDSGQYFRTVARLGVQAAEALQHAHDLGVLHRDIKPSNLMLDAEGKLFVTDFGLARIEADAGLTMTGDIIGTLRYMAPEQALAKRAIIDHRADVYSLGATLYELLTLEPAFGDSGRAELLKQIAFEEPRLLRTLDRGIPAELETIVLKAMAKQPEERYQTSQQLAGDLRAFLEDRPIKARPPSIVNRATKWSRRHRPLLAWIGVVLVLLTVGSLISTAGLLLERQRTALAAAESKAVVEFLVSDLLAAPKEEQRLDREVTVSEVLANAEAKIAAALEDQPLVEATVRQVMAESYQALKKFSKAEPNARRAVELRAAQLGAEDRETLRSASTLAQTLVGQGKFADARRLCEAALDVTRRRLGPEHPDTLVSMRQMVWVILQMKQAATKSDAEYAYRLCQETLDLSRRLLGVDHRNTLESMNHLSMLLRSRGEREEADRLCEEVLAVSRRVLGPEDPFTINSVESYANVLTSRGQLNEAAELYEEALAGQRRILGNKDPDTLRTMWMLTLAKIDLGKFDNAHVLAEEVLEIVRNLYGRAHPRALEAKQLLAFALRGQGKFDESRKLQEEILDWRRRSLGPEDPTTIAAMGDLAYVTHLQGNLDNALALYDGTIEISRRVLGADSVTTLEAMHQRSRVLNKQGKTEEALVAQQEVLNARRRVMGPHHPETLGSMCVLAVLLAKQGNFDESRGILDEALERLPANEWVARNSLAWFLATAKWPEIRDGQRALDQATKACEVTGYETATTLDTLAAAYAETGDFGNAVHWSENAIKLTSDERRRVEFAVRLKSYRLGKPWRMP